MGDVVRLHARDQPSSEWERLVSDAARALPDPDSAGMVRCVRHGTPATERSAAKFGYAAALAWLVVGLSAVAVGLPWILTTVAAAAAVFTAWSTRRLRRNRVTVAAGRASAAWNLLTAARSEASRLQRKQPAQHALSLTGMLDGLVPHMERLAEEHRTVTNGLTVTGARAALYAPDRDSLVRKADQLEQQMEGLAARAVAVVSVVNTTGRGARQLSRTLQPIPAPAGASYKAAVSALDGYMAALVDGTPTWGGPVVRGPHRQAN